MNLKPPPRPRPGPDPDRNPFGRTCGLTLLALPVLLPLVAWHWLRAWWSA
jgi:hypothetical protein